MNESQGVNFRDLDTCYRTTLLIITEAAYLMKPLLGTEFNFNFLKSSIYLRAKNVE